MTRFLQIYQKFTGTGWAWAFAFFGVGVCLLLASQGIAAEHFGEALSAGGLACFGGGGGSASTSNNTTTNNTDKRLVVSDNAIGVSADNSTVNITSTDHGAIGDAFDFAKSANADNAANYKNLLTSTTTAMRDLIGAQNSGVASILNGVGSMQNFIASTAASATGQMDNRTKMIIGLAGLGVVALLAWGKK